MKVAFEEEAWEDYLHWQKHDKKVFKRINQLIKDCKRTPFEGIGMPELLKYELGGFWSRRITKEHRLIYSVIDETIVITKCRYHY